jgi:hypothetical protein
MCLQACLWNRENTCSFFVMSSEIHNMPIGLNVVAVLSTDIRRVENEM